MTGALAIEIKNVHDGRRHMFHVACREPVRTLMGMAVQSFKVPAGQAVSFKPMPSGSIFDLDAEVSSILDSGIEYLELWAHESRDEKTDQWVKRILECASSIAAREMEGMDLLRRLEQKCRDHYPRCDVEIRGTLDEIDRHRAEKGESPKLCTTHPSTSQSTKNKTTS